MIKIFRVFGKVKGNRFALDVASTDKEHAIEKAYANLGSRHGATRHDIVIDDVKEIDPKETKSRVLKQLHGGD